MSTVPNQAQQPQVVSSDGGQNQQFQSSYRQDIQPAIAYSTGQGYTQFPLNNSRDASGPGLTHLFGGLNLQNQRPGSKYSTVKGNVPGPVGPNMDFTGVQRPYNPQFMFLPGGPMFGGIPQGAHFTQAQYPGHDQMSSLHYMHTGVYPGFVAGAPMMPSAVQQYAFLYSIVIGHWG